MNFKGLYEVLLKRSNTEKGNVFENYIKHFYKVYNKEVRHVYLWSEWEHRPHQDLGIDLVAEIERNNIIEYLAIQCKFKAKQETLSKKDIDSFLSLINIKFKVDGEQKSFSRGLVFTTSERISDNIQVELYNYSIPIKIYNYTDLHYFNVEWNTEPTKIIKKQRVLRDYQVRAIDGIEEGFKKADRGKLIMACGTGKTYVAIKLLDELKPNSILYVVPNLSLLQQTILYFNTDTETKYDILAVCSDQSIKTSDEDNLIISDKEIIENTGYKPTTDSKEINLFLNRKSKNKTIIFSTYQSLDKIQEAKDYKPFDIVICDEAHKTAGLVMDTKEATTFKIILDNSNIPYNKILFMTATPRIYTEQVKEKVRSAEKIKELYSMDVEAVYGQKFYSYSFGEAINDDNLSPYKVVILEVQINNYDKGKKDYFISEFTYQAKDTPEQRKNKELFHKIFFEFLKKPQGNGEEGLKKLLVFSNTVRQSKDFVNTINTTSIRDDYDYTVKAEHIDGSTKSINREQKLNWLKDDNNPREHKIISNARCLTEGIDVPDIDGIMFLTAKHSKIDIVQSVGRAIRKSPQKNYGYIIIPIIIPQDKDKIKTLKGSMFRETYEVLEALKSHDRELAIEINKIEINEKPSIIDTQSFKIKDEEGTHERINTAEQLELELDFAINPIYPYILKNVGYIEYVHQEELKNRSVYVADNLDVMRGINTGMIDLIYLDPPFNKNQVFRGKANINDNDMKLEYTDIYTRHNIDDTWLKKIYHQHNNIYEFITGIKKAGHISNYYYLMYMAIRLIEMHRILKPTGSVYLHCDHKMSHYLKILLDCIFGEKNFRNEIIWKRIGYKFVDKYAKSNGNIIDTILFYSKTDKTTFFKTKIIKDNWEQDFKYTDDKGRYRAKSPLYSHQYLKKSPKYEWNGHNPEYGWVVSKELLLKFEKEDRIHYNSKGKPIVKEYIEEYQGMNKNNLWDDIQIAKGKEKIGYPTQKPLALIDRIIQASSNEGDLVLDPFCGCATTCVSAEKLNRKWIGIDINPEACEIIKFRMVNEIEGSKIYGDDGKEIKLNYKELKENKTLPLYDNKEKPIHCLENNVPKRTDF